MPSVLFPIQLMLAGPCLGLVRDQSPIGVSNNLPGFLRHTLWLAPRRLALPRVLEGMVGTARPSEASAAVKTMTR